MASRPESSNFKTCWFIKAKPLVTKFQIKRGEYRTRKTYKGTSFCTKKFVNTKTDEGIIKLRVITARSLDSITE
jgi:hypothetical protein